MGKNKKVKDYASIVEEGYENETEREIAEIRKEIRQSKLEDSKPKSPINPLKLLAIICIWIFFFRMFINWGFGSVFFCFSIIVFIFTNLGKRKPWEVSAYSIFNRNFERLPGTLNLNDIQPGVFNNNINNQEANYNANVINNDIPENAELARLNNINRYNVSYKNNVKYETKHEKLKSEIKEKATQPLNSLCECDSGKKYKNCCVKKNE